VHPRTLVESRCAGGILGVDSKPDSSLAAAIELSEGMAQERKPQPALTPRAQHAEGTDPARRPTHPVALVTQGRGQVAKGAILTNLIGHDNEEYGIVTVYLRLKTMVPPS